MSKGSLWKDYKIFFSWEIPSYLTYRIIIIILEQSRSFFTASSTDLSKNTASCYTDGLKHFAFSLSSSLLATEQHMLQIYNKSPRDLYSRNTQQYSEHYDSWVVTEHQLSCKRHVST